MPRPNILNDIEELQKGISQLERSYLIGRYYYPEATIEEGTTQTLSINPLPSVWLPEGTTSNSILSGDYRIKSSHNPATNSNTLLSHAFDENPNTYYEVGSSVQELNITISLPSPIKINKLKYRLDTNIYNRNRIRILGSNDNNSWDILYEVEGETGVTESEITTKELTNKGYYQYYRLYFYRNILTGETIRLYEFQIAEYEVTPRDIRLTFSENDNIPTTSEMIKGQRILIKTPSYDTLGISTMWLNEGVVDTLMLPNRYYEIVYAGGFLYNAKEVI